jgi:pimeloyl-ACP methyl ester carboxylesterase
MADARVETPINREANTILGAEAEARPAEGMLADARQLPMPCWFIHGAGDPRPLDAVERLAEAIPEARIHVIENGGHEPWHEQPAALRHLLHQALVAHIK